MRYIPQLREIETEECSWSRGFGHRQWQTNAATSVVPPWHCHGRLMGDNPGLMPLHSSFISNLIEGVGRFDKIIGVGRNTLFDGHTRQCLEDSDYGAAWDFQEVRCGWHQALWECTQCFYRGRSNGHAEVDLGERSKARTTTGHKVAVRRGWKIWRPRRD